MSTRRDFIKKTAMAGALTSTFGVAHADGLERLIVSLTGMGTKETTPGRTPQIKSLVRRDETIIRNTAAHGDNWHMTWADDDRQYVSLCDGSGPFERMAVGYSYNSRLFGIEGGPKNHKFIDVPAYPKLIPDPARDPRYYNFGVIALDGKIYQFLSTYPVPLGEDTSKLTNLRFMGVKAIYSRDNGRTWRNQDGSTPVVWEDWNQRSKKTMLFFEEPQEAFSMLSVLQMGRGYRENRDGFVYVYAPNGNTEGLMNELVMFRVSKTRILDRQAYEYFAGLSSAGEANWTQNIDERGVVHKFPAGWVNKKLHPWAWIPSVTYNAPLGLYMMANWATGIGSEPDKEWFHKPSYLGFWTARQPWGPWTQVHEEKSWTPDGETAARCYSPIISPKWIAADGKSFWLVWTDYMYKDPEPREKERIEQLSDAALKKVELRRLSTPYYSFNLQRVDITI